MFQAYLTQIPASLQVTNIFGKLEDLLHYLCDLNSLKSQLDVHAGIIDNCDGFDDTDVSNKFEDIKHCSVVQSMSSISTYKVISFS